MKWVLIAILAYWIYRHLTRHKRAKPFIHPRPASDTKVVDLEQDPNTKVYKKR